MVQFGGLNLTEPYVCFSRCKCELYCDERAAKIPLGIEEAEPQVTPPFPTQKPFSLSAEICFEITKKITKKTKKSVIECQRNMV